MGGGVGAAADHIPARIRLSARLHIHGILSSIVARQVIERVFALFCKVVFDLHRIGSIV